MKRIYLLILSLFSMLLGCQEVKVNPAKLTPIEEPNLFSVTTGLEEISSDNPFIFKKYLVTKMGTRMGAVLFEDGSYFTINNKRKEAGWRKQGTVSQSGIKKIKRVMKTDVPRYINDPPTSIVRPLKDIRWFFNTEPTMATRTQVASTGYSIPSFKTFLASFNTKFVRKINRHIDRHLVWEYQSKKSE